MKKKLKCFVCHKEINEEEDYVFKGQTVHKGECLKSMIDEYNTVRNLQIRNKRLCAEIERLHSIIKEVRELAIIKKARVENEPDYSKSYLEGYENAIQAQHLSHSGVMLETIKSTIKTTCNDFLEILDKENK